MKTSTIIAIFGIQLFICGMMFIIPHLDIDIVNWCIVIGLMIFLPAAVILWYRSAKEESPNLGHYYLRVKYFAFIGGVILMLLVTVIAKIIKGR